MPLLRTIASPATLRPVQIQFIIFIVQFTIIHSLGTIISARAFGIASFEKHRGVVTWRRKRQRKKSHRPQQSSAADDASDGLSDGHTPNARHCQGGTPGHARHAAGQPHDGHDADDANDDGRGTSALGHRPLGTALHWRRPGCGQGCRARFRTSSGPLCSRTASKIKKAWRSVRFSIICA